MAFTLAPLPYSFDALEPHIDARTMEIHHGKHHAAYIKNLNAALDGAPDLAAKALPDLLTSLPSIQDEAVRNTIRNNGGGHWNHRFFCESLSPRGGGVPDGALGEALTAAFGSFDAFKEKFAQAGMTRFGSGWAWLILKDGKLEICSTPNQDNPLMDIAEQKGTPILGLDVWEHAYYLNYQNRRPDYIEAFYHIINWSEVEKRYLAAL